MKISFFIIFLVIASLLIPQNSYAISISASPRTAHFGPNDWIMVDLAITGYVGGNVNWIAHRPNNSTISGSLENLQDGKIAHQIKRSAIDNDFGNWSIDYTYNNVHQTALFVVDPVFTPKQTLILELSLDKSIYRLGEILNATIHTNTIVNSVSFWFEDPSGKQGAKNSIPVSSIDMSISHKINKNDMQGLWKIHVEYGGTTKVSSFHVEGIPEDADDISNIGTPPTLILTLGSGNIKFKNPRSIAIDSADNAYVVDSGNSEIKKFDSTGNFLLSWGTYGTEHGQFKNPTGIFASKKYVYVADTGNVRIQKFDKNGNFVYTWGSFGDVPGMFHTPVSLAADNSGDLFVSDSRIDKILVFDSNGKYKDEIRSLITIPAKFSSSNFITFDSKNNFYLVISNENRVLQYSSIGTFIKSFGTMGDGRGQFDVPSSIDVDSGGNLYVADTRNYRIQKFDSHGNFLRSWGSFGTDPGQFKEPIGIAVDSHDDVYVVDKANNTVQKFSLYTQDKIIIPDWIRNNAKWWSEGRISDSDFVEGIQYMITQKIIHIPNGESAITDSGVSIPSWIKTSAGWWSDKKISDTSFVNGIQYLVSIGIIR